MPKRIDPKLKARVIADAKATNPEQAGKKHGVHPSTVRRWIGPKAAKPKAPKPKRAPVDHDDQAVDDDAQVDNDQAVEAPADPAPWRAEGFEPVQLELVESEPEPSTESPAGTDLANTDEKPPKEKPEKQAKKETGAKVLGVDEQIDPAVLINPLVDIADRRLTKYDAEPITKEEREALVGAWGPVLKKWLEGPVETWQVAAFTTVAILGPRTLTARKNAVAARQAEQEPVRRLEPAVEDRSAKADVVKALRSPRFEA